MCTRPKVYLIGAGPGNPGLITVRGLDMLRQKADVVIHDHLVSPRAACTKRGRSAELIDVGTAAPEPEWPRRQSAILIGEKAREGKLLARLKWGDPFVFDRGGEEALFLHEQGIPFEVIPGNPRRRPACRRYAGVPVTYPGGGDTVTLSPRLRRRKPACSATSTGPVLAQARKARSSATPARSSCRHARSDASEWLAGGEPVVIVYNGTLQAQETVAARSASWSSSERVSPARAGDSRRRPAWSGFRDHLRWFDVRPLFGRRVLVTRPREQAGRYGRTGCQCWAPKPVEAPMIRITAPEDRDPLAAGCGEDRALRVDRVHERERGRSRSWTGFIEGAGDVRELNVRQLCARSGRPPRDRLSRYGVKHRSRADRFSRRRSRRRVGHRITPLKDTTIPAAPRRFRGANG